MDERYLEITLRSADGRELRSDHRFFNVGGDIVTIISASAAARSELQSTYVQPPGGPRVLVAELALIGQDPATATTREITPGWDAAGRNAGYLVDHLHRLSELASAEVAQPVRVEGLDAALIGLPSRR